MRKRIQDFIRKLNGSAFDIRTKIFILLTIIGIMALVLALITDLIIGEDPVEILILAATLIAVPVITNLSVRKNRMQVGAMLISSGIVFILMPIIFFFGGGVDGGGIIWICFAYLYIGLTLIGAARIVLMSALTVIIVAEFIISYLNPQLFPPRDSLSTHLDLLVSLLLVGFACYFMVLYQYRLYLSENTKAREQAERIESMNRAQNRFFSSMSHEIRTPINTIIGLNEMILRENVNAEVNENARNIQAASNILLSLINDILDMSKIESGRMDIIRAQYDVGEMLSEIVNMIWIRAREKGLKFSVSVDPGMPSQLFCDEVRLKQILINLLNNAVKYTPEGSVTLSVHCIRTGSGMAHVTYSVEDTGMGIRKENIPYLFDAFRREDEQKNRYIEGTGLGLSIVKQLVELLGGTISVNSVYTKGSDFVVEIDQEIADDHMIGDFDSLKLHAAYEKYEYEQSFEAPEASVLVVDDNTTNLLVVKKLLKDTKVKLTTAESGEECLKLTQQRHFDVILMDHLMPGMDGIECMHRIKDQPGGLCKETPVVALTANAGSENQALYRKEGFDEYLVKPVDPAELELKVQSLLPADLVSRKTESGESFASDMVVREMRKKIPILITTESMADIPPELINRLGIPVISCRVRLEKGVFYDNRETGSDAITQYMEDSTVTARSESPSVTEYEEFFSEQLTRAQHIIHITTAKYASNSYVNACEAALSFSNVRVVDSGHLSSGTGLLALHAFDLAESGRYDPEEVIEELEKKNESIRFSFIIRTTEFLYRSGRLAGWIDALCSTLMVHPVIGTRDSRIRPEGMIIGDYDKVTKKYIRSVLHHPDDIDRSVLFITYVGMKYPEIEEVRRMAEEIVPFEKIYLTKAAPSIAINCGPGTFGLIFSRK